MSGHGTWACVIIKKIKSVNANDKLWGIFNKLNILKIKINLIENINEVQSPKLKKLIGIKYETRLSNP